MIELLSELLDELMFERLSHLLFSAKWNVFEYL